MCRAAQADAAKSERFVGVFVMNSQVCSKSRTPACEPSPVALRAEVAWAKRSQRKRNLDLLFQLDVGRNARLRIVVEEMHSTSV